jgi:hypothetical protein
MLHLVLLLVGSLGLTKQLAVVGRCLADAEPRPD